MKYGSSRSVIARPPAMDAPPVRRRRSRGPRAGVNAQTQGASPPMTRRSAPTSERGDFVCALESAWCVAAVADAKTIAAARARRGRSDLLERGGEVGDQVGGVLDADGVADEVVLDADEQALLGREL